MNSDRSRSDDGFVDTVRDVLNAQTLTPETTERLRAARRNAVAAATSKSPRVRAVWLPVGALAATVLTVVLLRPSIDPDVAPLDVDVQLAAADLDLLENLEFAAWMVESDTSDAG